MKIETAYNFGNIVFLITDEEQLERMVTGIIQRPGGLLYELSCGVTTTTHYDFEIASSKDILKSVGVDTIQN